MTPSELQLQALLDHHTAPHGYAIVSFDYFEQDAYYKIRLDRFDMSDPITLIIFPDELVRSVNNKELAPAIAQRFDTDLPSVACLKGFPCIPTSHRT